MAAVVDSGLIYPVSVGQTMLMKTANAVSKVAEAEAAELCGIEEPAMAARELRGLSL
jgi:hypothetical protein